MSRKLPCGMQYNLYVDNDTLPHFRKMQEEAYKQGLTPSGYLCKLLRNMFVEVPKVKGTRNV